MFSETTKHQVLLANNGRIVVKKPLKWLYPKAAEMAYQQQIVNLVSQPFIKEISEKVLPKLLQLINEVSYVRPDSARADTWVDTVEQLVSTIKFSYSSLVKPDMFERAAQQQALKVSLYNKEQFYKVIRSSLSIDPIINEPYLQSSVQSFVAQNTTLIKNLTDQQIAKVQQTLMQGLSSGDGLTKLREELQKDADFSKQRAALIARDQTNKYNGQLAELRQVELGIEEYIWDDVNDDRERPAHIALGDQARAGKTRKWSDNNEKPGQAIRCRCTAQPVITDKLFTD